MASDPSKAFKDISLSFQPHPVTGDIPVLKNEDAIKRAVRNLIETSSGAVSYTHLTLPTTPYV